MNWDQRYSSEHYVYGTEPNGFLAEQVAELPKGKILCLADGEGRNSVWLAQQGFEVTAVDSSMVGLNKAQQLAQGRGVSIQTVLADLADYDMGTEHWDAIVSIFCHLPSTVRLPVHQRCVRAIRPGGVMLLEAYTPNQLTFKTGGPPSADLMTTASDLSRELAGLDFIRLEECVRDVIEGEFHTGPGAVVQAIARKPMPD